MYKDLQTKDLIVFNVSVDRKRHSNVMSFVQQISRYLRAKISLQKRMLQATPQTKHENQFCQMQVFI